MSIKRMLIGLSGLMFVVTGAYAADLVSVSSGAGTTNYGFVHSVMKLAST